jgi:hypothetical protein
MTEQAHIKAYVPKKGEDGGNTAPPAAAAVTVSEIHALNKDEVDEDETYCVLHGWGRVHPGAHHFIDSTRFQDGVAYNVPGPVVKRWMTGRMKNGEEAASRVYLQAVLDNKAQEADFARVTGIELMPAQRLATLIRASDLNAILQALGPKDAAAIARKLLELSGEQHPRPTTVGAR